MTLMGHSKPHKLKLGFQATTQSQKKQLKVKKLTYLSEIESVISSALKEAIGLKSHLMG